MDLKEMSVSVETSTITKSVTKPATVIANAISREHLKVLELKENCKIIECDLKECENAVQMLISWKNESAKIKTDYKIRHKINVTNSESLLQAKNELYKYKSELKSSYITTEKALKLKKLKYKKIISSYESDWQRALNEFNANPVVVELKKLEEENVGLERKIEKQEKLNYCTEKQFLELKKYIRWTFLKKLVEFSKIMIKYREFSDLQKRNKEIASLEPHKNSPRNFDFALFKVALPFSGKNSLGFESNDDINCFSNIDVSIFDELMVPSENLESEHMDEDIDSTPQFKEQSSDISKDEEDDSRSPDEPKHFQGENQEIKNSSNFAGGGNSTAMSAKVTTVHENESQYFRLQPPECSVHPKNMENKSKKLKPEVPMQSAQGNEQVHRKRKMECEESLSDGSNEMCDCRYRKMPSISSDDFPPPIENTNEEPESPQKPNEEEESHLFKAGESENTSLKPFAGFFTMGNDYKTPKPSIFKLFGN